MRSTLKEATQEAHALLEGRLALMRTDASLDDYRVYLGAMLGYVAPLEDAFRELPAAWGEEVGLAGRFKSDLLRADLSLLAPSEGTPPACAALPRIADVDAAYGALYVLEGSTLGGPFVARHVRALHGLEVGLSFLHSYAARTGAMWKDFCAALEAHAARDEARPEAIVGAANETFRTLGAWLGRRGALV